MGTLHAIGTGWRRLASRVGLRDGTDEAEAVRASGLFDGDWYLRRYPELAAEGIDPAGHYVRTGAREGRAASEFFDTAYYLAENPDVAASGMNPLLHFAEFGWKESRHPSAGFDVDWYLAAHFGEGPEGWRNPLRHYLAEGRARGLEIRPVADPDLAVLREAGVFDADYYRRSYPDVAESGADPLRHYLKYGAAEGRNPSAMFDTAYYLQHNPDVARSGANPLVHFCTRGWKELRNPGREFDVWWYWSKHLDPASEAVNPLGHYQRQGAALGLDTRPPRHVAQRPGSGHRLPQGPVRRLCLFAGYDRDGRVDDCVVDYVRELSRHADVYYLADCELHPGELDRLAPYVKGAWAERHGGYDFGSYARLAARLGWDRIGTCDELLLVNDSCYLLGPLDEVFARMDRRPCDWWGLQATKGLASTRLGPLNRFQRPIPMDVVRGSLLEAFEQDYTYDFLVGSYFVAYRQPVLRDPQFARLLASVAPQSSKRNLILKYEVGLTRHLIARGHAFDTFVGALYPFHPVYSNWYFSLLDEGFPLLKRYFLAENHYQVPGLADWEARIRQKVPQAPTGAIRRSLERVTDPERLRRSLDPEGLRASEDRPVPAAVLDDDAFREADRATPKYAHWWAFPACGFSGAFSGNERAVFEEVKRDARIRKIVLTRDRPVAVDGDNVEVAPLQSPRGQYLLMRAGNVFIKHSPTRNLVYPLAWDLHNLINLWHGVPFKRIGYASADMQDRLDRIAEEHARCRAVISASKVDTLAMAAAFYPLSYGDIWNTGLPRNDFILRREEGLPDDLRAQLTRLRALVGDRRLVLFMPTFRNAQEDACYRFSDAEKAWLAGWLERNGAVLGIREHMADSARTYSAQLRELDALDLSDREFVDGEMLYRASSALVTDYSSCFIDYLLTGKPSVSFAYDLDHYLALERGAFYDLDLVFPGPVCRSFEQLEQALDRLFAPPAAEARARHDWCRRLFFDHADDRSAARVVERVRQLSDTGGLGAPPLKEGWLG